MTTRPLGELQGEDFECADWGFTIKAITRHMQIERQLSDTLGVLVVGVKRVGAADLGGLRPGDVVRSVNKQQIDGLTELVSTYNDLFAEDASKILLTVRRGSATRLIVLNVDGRGDREAGLIDE